MNYTADYKLIFFFRLLSLVIYEINDILFIKRIVLTIKK